MRWLDKIKRKSDSEKKSFAFFSAMAITGFVFLVWLFSMFNSLQGEKSNNLASPFSTIRNQFEDIFEGANQVYEAK